MPLTGPNTRAAMATRSLVTSQNAAGLGQVITVNMVFNRTFVAEDLFDALETKYGSGKVTSDSDTIGRTGPFNFRIAP